MLARLPEHATYQCILFILNRLPYLLCITHLLLAVQMRYFANLGFRPLMSDLQHPLSSFIMMLYHPTQELGPQLLNQTLSIPTCLVYTHLILPPPNFFHNGNLSHKYQKSKDNSKPVLEWRGDGAPKRETNKMKFTERVRPLGPRDVLSHQIQRGT